ncbi:MAG: glycerate kinase [Candidatus Neomarinimicrobiota bacterium]
MSSKSPKIVLSPDSFKGCLTAKQVAEALRVGILRGCPSAEVVSVPLSDGGEGFTESVLTAVGGCKIECTVLNPRGTEIIAAYAVLSDDATVLIETAAASGLSLIDVRERNPLLATSYGTGQLIRAAIDAGYRKFAIGLGGSATVDGGTGLVQALGVKFFDANGTPITQPMNNELLNRCGDVDLSGLYTAIKDAAFIMASDVTNPLLGATGAVNIFAVQKGATPEMLPALENNLSRFYDLAERKLGRIVRNVPGAGAAGGIGAGLLLFLNATVRSGIEMVLELTEFRQKINDADLIVTGEGRIDEQTAFGKTIAGVLKCAGEKRIPVVAVAGKKDGRLEELTRRGLREIFTLTERVANPEDAFTKAPELIAQVGEEIVTKWFSG